MQQQIYLSSEGVHHMLELFMKSSSFTRYLLDEVLPRETIGNRIGLESDLDDLFEECESLIVSLKTFKQLHKMLNLGEKIASTSGSDGASGLDKKVVNTIPFKLIESFKAVQSLTLNSDFSKIKLYYCEICDDSSYLDQKANDHFSSKQHSASLISSTFSYSSYQCKVCSLFILATQPILKEIINSAVHGSVDGLLKRLRSSATFESGFRLREGNSLMEYEKNQVSCPKKQDISLGSEIGGLCSRSSNNCDEAVAEEGKATLISENNDCEDNFKQTSVVQAQKTYYMNKWFISPVFVECNDRLLSEQLNDSFYCRPCDVGYTCRDEWNKHKNNPEHLKFMNDRGFRNSCERCFNCPLELIGCKPTVKVYLRYHKEKNHKIYRKLDQSWDQRNNSSFKKKQFFSAYNDDKKSLSDMSDRSIEKDETKNQNYELEKSISSLDYAVSLSSYPTSDVECNESSEKEPCEERLERARYARKQPCKSDPFFILFVKALNEKRREYVETKGHSFKGVCLPCSLIIRDYFDWLEHISKVHVDKRDGTNKERECEKCNIYVYGKPEFIIKELWYIKEHNDLDQLVY